MVKGFLIVFCFLLTTGVAFSQQIETNAKSPNPAPMSKLEKNAIKKKEKQTIKIEKAEAKGRKEHLKIQTKATRKRMRQSKREAKRHNENRKEFFLKRWFHKNH